MNSKMLKNINNAQISKIWATAKEQGIDKENVYALVYQVSEQESMRELTWEQANDVINKLVGTDTYGGFREIGRENTEGMRKKIYMLTVDLGWNKNTKRLEGLCKRLFKVEKVEWLNAKQCWRLIETLKDMVKRKEQYK